MDRNDLISRSALREEVNKKNVVGRFNTLLLIDNAPPVELFCSYLSDEEVRQPCVEGPCKYERPQGDIRWTDKLSIKSNGDIIDFEGRVVGHINLEEMKEGEEE